MFVRTTVKTVEVRVLNMWGLCMLVPSGMIWSEEKGYEEEL